MSGILLWQVALNEPKLEHTRKSPCNKAIVMYAMGARNG